MSFSSVVGPLRADFEAYAEARFAALRWPAQLLEATRYTFFGGGKRVRPLLALMAAEAVGDARAALPWALAVEMIHTYSLVHDDLPAMDDDDARRGKPTVHVRYDEATAILVGDALLTQAFAEVAEGPAIGRLTPMLAGAAGGAGMVGGQVEDILGVDGPLALEAMQRKKTGALILAAAVGGALAAGAEATALAAVTDFAAELGLLFQITDDLLDEEQDADADGRSYLHHYSKAEVCARRDALASSAREALAHLGAKGDTLAAFVDLIAHRET